MTDVGTLGARSTEASGPARPKASHPSLAARGAPFSVEAKNSLALQKRTQGAGAENLRFLLTGSAPEQMTMYVYRPIPPREDRHVRRRGGVTLLGSGNGGVPRHTVSRGFPPCQSPF